MLENFCSNFVDFCSNFVVWAKKWDNFFLNFLCRLLKNTLKKFVVKYSNILMQVKIILIHCDALDFFTLNFLIFRRFEDFFVTFWLIF